LQHKGSKNNAMSKNKATTTFDAEPSRVVNFGNYSLADTASVLVDSSNPFQVEKKEGLRFNDISVTDNGEYAEPRYSLVITFDGSPDLSKVNEGEMLGFNCPDYENTGYSEIISVDDGNDTITVEGAVINIDNTYTPDETAAETYPLIGGYFIECEVDEPSLSISDESGTRTIGMFAGQVKQADRITKLTAPNGRVKLYLL